MTSCILGFSLMISCSAVWKLETVFINFSTLLVPRLSSLILLVWFLRDDAFNSLCLKAISYNPQFLGCKASQNNMMKIYLVKANIPTPYARSVVTQIQGSYPAKCCIKETNFGNPPIMNNKIHHFSYGKKVRTLWTVTTSNLEGDLWFLVLDVSGQVTWII